MVDDIEELLWAGLPLRRGLQEHLESMKCFGVVRKSGRIAVTEDEHTRHLHCPRERVEACFGEWAFAPDCGDSSSSSSSSNNSCSKNDDVKYRTNSDESDHIVPRSYELILMPEEAIYLACVVGCLEISSGPERELPAGESLLDRLLRLAAEEGDEMPRSSSLDSATSSASSNSPVPSSYYAAYVTALVRTIVYRHFLHAGYTVKDGIIYGVHFLLYNGSPETVHSDFGVWITGLPRGVDGTGGNEMITTETLTWFQVQGLTRLLHDNSKDLVLCSIEEIHKGDATCSAEDMAATETSTKKHRVVEIRMAPGFTVR